MFQVSAWPAPSEALSVLAQRRCRLAGVPAALWAVTAPPLIDSLVKVAMSLPITPPVPATPPPSRFLVMVEVKPSAAKAALLELATDRLEAVPVFSVITPPLLTDDPVAPESASILPSSIVMLSVTLIWFGPDAPAAMKVSG